MPGTERLQGRLADAQAVTLVAGFGQLSVGPVGAPPAGGVGPADDPVAEDGGKLGEERGGGALGLLGPQSVEVAVEVGVEPALDGARRDAEVLSDVLVGPSAGRHQDDLHAVAE